MNTVIKPLILLLALFGPSAAIAAGEAQEVFTDRTPLVVREDTAYLLLRSDPRARNQPHGIADVMQYEFVLVPEAAVEVARGQSAPPDPATSQIEARRLFRTGGPKLYDKTPDAEFHLVSIPPGRYVIADVKWARGDGAGTCLCMGTVSFDATPGVVTDLGYLLAAIEDLPTDIPELKAYAGPRPTRYLSYPNPMIAAVRSFSPGMPVPPTLASVPIVAADYRAEGKFPNIFRAVIGRLVPLKGVLDYDEDRVLDLRAR